VLDGSCFNLMHKFSWTIESFQTQLLYYLDRVRIRNRLIVHVEVGVKQIGGSKEVPHAREASYWVEPCLGDLRNSSKLKVVKQIEEFFLVIRRCMQNFFNFWSNKQTSKREENNEGPIRRDSSHYLLPPQSNQLLLLTHGGGLSLSLKEARVYKIVTL
jgi:hypothetical protein